MKVWTDKEVRITYCTFDWDNPMPKVLCGVVTGHGNFYLPLETDVVKVVPASAHDVCLRMNDDTTTVLIAQHRYFLWERSGDPYAVPD